MQIILFCYGSCLGSFGTAWAYRRMRQESLLYPDSHCETCQTPLKPWQLIPIWSYLILRGRCTTCQTPITPVTFVAEVLGGTLLTTLNTATWLPISWLACWGLAALHDWHTQTFPAWLSWIGLSLALWGHSPVVWLIVVFINSLINWLWSRWSVPTIGNGDLEFFLSYGLMWGLTAMAHWLLLAASLALIINRRTAQLAFIPYLLISALFWWLMAS